MRKYKTKLANLAGSLFLAMLLAACRSTATPVPATAVAAVSALPSNVPATPTATSVPVSSSTAALSGATASSVSAGGLTPLEMGRFNILDDRSNAVQILRSFYNALNRREYVRAYSYWLEGNNANGNDNLPPYPQFEQGYTTTREVSLAIGQLTGDTGVGNYTVYVPVQIKATDNNDKVQWFGGCYVTRQANPLNFATPPFVPLQIGKANITAASSEADALQNITQNCQKLGATASGVTNLALPVADPANISAASYLDDRSNGIQILRSFYNALNRKEYARAYGYWLAGAITPPPAFADFEKGYVTTASFGLTIGAPINNGGAESAFTQVPVIITARQTGGKVVNSVGCYTTRQLTSGVIGTPPYIPPGLYEAQVNEVQKSSGELQGLLRQACQQ